MHIENKQYVVYIRKYNRILLHMLDGFESMELYAQKKKTYLILKLF
jgi:hypothetical protein